MTLSLSAADLARFAAALQALAAPLDHGDFDAWRSQVNTHLKALIGADGAVFNVPHEVSLRPVFSDDYPGAPPEEYLALFRPIDEKYRVNDRLACLGVSTRRDFWRPIWQEYVQSIYYNEFLLPNRMLDAIILAAPVTVNGARESIQVLIQRGSTADPPFGEQEKALLRMLHPAFQAGMEAWLRLGAQREALAGALDALGVALALVGLDGRVLHQTPALTALLQAAPERERLAVGIRTAARAATGALTGGRAWTDAPTTPSLEMATGGGHYRARACTMREGAFGPDPVALVLVERAAALPPSDEVLRNRYGLTRQQVRVARLLAERRTNGEIAAALFVSLSTARHHAEHVMEKLGVRSRKAVAAALGLEP